MTERIELYAIVYTDHESMSKVEWYPSLKAAKYHADLMRNAQAIVDLSGTVVARKEYRDVGAESVWSEP